MPNQAPATAAGAGAGGAQGQQAEAATGSGWQSILRSIAMFIAMQAGESELESCQRYGVSLTFVAMKYGMSYVRPGRDSATAGI